MDETESTISGATSEGTVLFEDTLAGKVKSRTDKWKKEEPQSYNLHYAATREIVRDIIQLKKRTEEAAKLYFTLNTTKGRKTFAETHANFLQASIDEAVEIMKEKTKEASHNNPESMAGAQRKEFKTFGNSDITDAKIIEDIEKGIEKYSAISDTQHPDDRREDIEKVLDGYPGLFLEVKNRLLEKGIANLNGISTTATLRAQDTNDQLYSEVENMLLTMSEDVSLVPNAQAFFEL